MTTVRLAFLSFIYHLHSAEPLRMEQNRPDRGSIQQETDGDPRDPQVVESFLHGDKCLIFGEALGHAVSLEHVDPLEIAQSKHCRDRELVDHPMYGELGRAGEKDPRYCHKDIHERKDVSVEDRQFIGSEPALRILVIYISRKSVDRV